MKPILIDPELTHAHYALGGVQYGLGNVKAAIHSYRRAIELQPNFPDARYRLALLLKLTNRDQEAAPFMEEAAIGGVPQAQFFSGNAYRSGQGVAKNLGRAIFWWAKAVEFGHQPAAETLAKLRRQALSADQTDRRRHDALEGFRTYRALLREEFPDYNRPDEQETLGATLLKNNRERSRAQLAEDSDTDLFVAHENVVDPQHEEARALGALFQHTRGASGAGGVG